MINHATVPVLTSSCLQQQSSSDSFLHREITEQDYERARMVQIALGLSFFVWMGGKYSHLPKRQTATQRTTDKQQRPVYIIITGLFKTH